MISDINKCALIIIFICIIFSHIIKSYLINGVLINEVNFVCTESHEARSHYPILNFQYR